MLQIDVQRDADVRLLLRSGRVTRGNFVSSDGEVVTLRDTEGLARIPHTWIIDWQLLEPVPAETVVNPSPPPPAVEAKPQIARETIEKTEQAVQRVRTLIAEANLKPAEPSFSSNGMRLLPAQHREIEREIGKLKDQWEYTHNVRELSRLQSLRIPLLHLVNRYPKVAAFASIQGHVALELNNRALALDAFARAVQIAPDPDSLLNLAVASGYHNRAVMLDALVRYFDNVAPSANPTAWYVLLGAAIELKHTARVTGLMKKWVDTSDSCPLIVDSLTFLLSETGAEEQAHSIVAQTTDSAVTEVHAFLSSFHGTESTTVASEIEQFWKNPQLLARQVPSAPPPAPHAVRRSVNAPTTGTGTSPRNAIQPVSRAIQHPTIRPVWPSVRTASSDMNPLQAGRAAFDAGDLPRAREVYSKAYERGDRSMFVLFTYAQTLQRLGEFSEALQLLDAAIPNYKNDSDLSKLITLRAQILSARQLWNEAAETYERLLKVETRPAAVRHARLQLASMYHRAGDRERARAVLTDFLERNPTDEVARRQLGALDAPIPEAIDLAEDDVVGDFTVDVPEPEGTVSPLLRSDLETAQFRDEIVLAKGGVDQFDAQRLLDRASSVKNADFPERYPLFLEAAKAFNALPEGSYNLEDLLNALSRYSMLKAGALMSELQRRLSTSGKIEEIRSLGDSTTSYYLEALVLQATLKPEFTLLPLTNYLRVQLACTLRARGEAIPPQFFNWPLAALFRLCTPADAADLRTNPHARDLTKVALDTVISCAAARGKSWNAISRHHGQLRALLSRMLSGERRAIVYQMLSDLCGIKFSIDQTPGDVLRQAFMERTRRIIETAAFCESVGRIGASSSQNFRELRSKWLQFPNYADTLLATDRIIKDQIDNLLATLSPYWSRSQEERTTILFTGRSMIEKLLQFIEKNPTRWGREAFEPLLNGWQKGIRDIEQMRAKQIQPKLRVRLETEIFTVERDVIRGGIIIENVGLGTADGVAVNATVRDYDTAQVIWSRGSRISEEIAAKDASQEVGGSKHVPIEFGIELLTGGVEAHYLLDVELTTIFRQSPLASPPQPFTIQIGDPATFQLADIPWDELKPPSEQLFKGRDDLLNKIVGRLRSADRMRTHILYGLTRTGKTSLLHHLHHRLDLNPTEVVPSQRFVCIDWKFDGAGTSATANDLAAYLFTQEIRKTLLALPSQYRALADHEVLMRPARLSDWEAIARMLVDRGLYPVFLIDEFTYYQQLADKGCVDASFLALMRSLALNGLASFVCAGTYSLRALMRNPAYGITGQFVNASEIHVRRIERKACFELMDVMVPELTFTADAKEHIADLSHQLPYFVQLICKKAAGYALATKRRVLGFPEIERVAQVITGQLGTRDTPGVEPIELAAFNGNMYMQYDPPRFAALFTTICSLQGETSPPRFVAYREIQDAWRNHGIVGFEGALAETIEELVERGVLIEATDERMPTYRLGAELFQRWWSVHHPHLESALDALKKTL